MSNTINRKELYNLVFQLAQVKDVQSKDYPTNKISFLKFITKVTPKIHFDHTLFEDIDDDSMFANFCQLDDFHFHSLINEIIHNRDIFVFNILYLKNTNDIIGNPKKIDYLVPITRNNYEDVIRKYILDNILIVDRVKNLSEQLNLLIKLSK